MEFNMTELETETRDYTGVTTEQVIVEMLTENTGSSLCDSGGAYGRNWQRNQGKSFADQPVVNCTWSTWRKDGEEYGTPEMIATVSLYHWMVRCLDFDPEMQKQLDEFMAREDMEDESYLGIQEHFAAYLHERDGHEKEPNTINTCNDPDGWDCSQVLQYVALYLEDSYEPSHLIVSVHGGCDYRGGYTAPKCFKLGVEYYEALEKASVRSLGVGEHWWDYSDRSWSGGCEHSEVAAVDDIFDIPCFDSEWLREDPALAEIDKALKRVPREREALQHTSLTDDQKRSANLQLDNAAGKLEADLFDNAINLLGERHEAFTVIRHGKLFLSKNGGMFGEVTVFNNL